MFQFAILTEKVAFERRTLLDAIQSFDRNYLQDFQKASFLENRGCTFSLVHTVKFASAMKSWSRNIDPELSTSHTGSLITMITYHKYPATTVYRYWSKYLTWYVGVGDEYC